MIVTYLYLMSPSIFESKTSLEKTLAVHYCFFILRLKMPWRQSICHVNLVSTLGT